MAWNAVKTARNTLHVMNDETLQHFEAKSEDEVHEVLAELAKREEERKAAEAAAQDTSGDLNMPVGSPVGEIGRIN